MPLTHVCFWDSKVGYRPVSVEEADEMYPYETVPADNRSRFVCDLCAQNIGFTKPRKGTGTRHFYHSRGEQNKECEDRAQVFERIVLALNSHTMPLRIKVHNFQMHFELGFFYPNSTNVSLQGSYQIKIRGASPQPCTYSSERIENSGITYLFVGSEPAEKYKIEYINLPNNYTRFWPSEAPGISSKGTFFEKESGRILHPGAKASTKKSYYLLQDNMLFSWETPSGISTKLITQYQSNFSGRWYLYQIDIKTFSPSVARFFLQRSIFLTEAPTEFYPIWPPYVEDPYFIYHNESDLYFHMRGEQAELKTFPITPDYYDPKSQKTGDGKLYKIHAASKEQLLSLGLSGAIGFSYLLKKELNMTAPLPEVRVEDSNCTILDPKVYSSLPKANRIIVTAQFDGKVVFLKNGSIQSISWLSADQAVTVDHLSFGSEIQVFQGCDCVQKVSFEKENHNYNAASEDVELVAKLKACTGTPITISHSMGAIANKLADYPQTKKWIYTKIRCGEMPYSAYQLLKYTANSRRGRNV